VERRTKEAQEARRTFEAKEDGREAGPNKTSHDLTSAQHRQDHSGFLRSVIINDDSDYPPKLPSMPRSRMQRPRRFYDEGTTSQFGNLCQEGLYREDDKYD
jgi:hypothetical protein